MHCERLPVEVYALSVLGQLEEPELAELRAHIEQGCETCAEALARSREMWFLYGAAAAPRADPGRSVRRRVVESVKPAGTPAFFGWAWQGALAAAVVLSAALGWVGRERYGAPQVAAPANPPVTARARPVAEPPALVEAPPVLILRPSPASLPPAPPDRAPELEMALVRARAETDAASRALTLERARASQMEAELAQVRTERTAGDRSRQDLASGAQRELAAAAARVRDLEREVAQYKAVAEEQKLRLDRSVQLANFLVSPSVRILKVRAAGKGEAAVGHAFTDGRRVVFVASQLGAPPPGKTYQLWLIRSRSPAIVSGGTFTTDAQNRALVQFENAALASDITAVAVTDEPLGGSARPTGRKVLIGS